MARTFMPAFDVARTHTEGRMGTLRKVATWLLGATMACIFVYGLVRFLTAPYIHAPSMDTAASKGNRTPSKTFAPSPSGTA